MSDIHAIFWDVGGVLLTNAWDHNERAPSSEHFHLDQEEFQSRHEMVVSSFERGKITLDEYLDRTVFYRARPFTREEFRGLHVFVLATDDRRFGLRACSCRFWQVFHGHDQQRVPRVKFTASRNMACAKSSGCL